MTGTPQRIGVLALVAVLLGSVVAAGPAAAAASSVSLGSGSYTVAEDGTGDITVDVSADSSGITEETLAIGIQDPEVADSQNPVVQKTKTINVSASSTQSFTFSIDASTHSNVLDAGETYDVYADAPDSGVTTAPVSLTVEQSPSVSIGSDPVEFDRSNDETTVGVTVDAGDQPVSDTVEFTVDANGTEQYSATQSVDINASETQTVEFAVNHSDVDLDAIDEDENASVTAALQSGGYSAQADASVQSGILGGGAVGDGADFGGDGPLIIGGIVAVVALLALAARAQ